MKRTLSESTDIEAVAADWIARLDAGLGTAELNDFDRWKAADARHEEAIRRHEQAWSISHRPLGSGQSRAMLQELAARASRRRHRRIAGSFTLALLLTGGVFWQVSRQAAPLITLTKSVVVSPEKRILADGSVIELKDGAGIAVDFSPSLRRVVLEKGEAHFQIVGDPRRPFIVSAAGVDVRAVGTSFSVHLTTVAVEILVTDGRVAVGQSAPSGTSAASPAMAGAGNRVVVSLQVPITAPPVVSPVSVPEVNDLLAWRSPRLEFSATSLGEAVALMNRYNRVQLVVGDPSLASLEVSGYFRADSTDSFLRLMEQSLGLTSERSGDTITLRKSR